MAKDLDKQGEGFHPIEKIENGVIEKIDDTKEIVTSKIDNVKEEISSKVEEAKEEAHQTTEKAKKKISKALIIVGIIIVIIAIIIIVVFVSPLVKRNDGVKISATSVLNKVFEIGELSSVEYFYNAIATKLDDENEPIYYVYYEGKVTLGIDFEDIDYSVDEQNKNIIIKIPEIRVLNSSVDAGTLDYIFVETYYEQEGIGGEAYSLCISDLEKRAEVDDSLYDIARENIEKTVKALTQPLIETLDGEYTVNIQ